MQGIVKYCEKKVNLIFFSHLLQENIMSDYWCKCEESYRYCCRYFVALRIFIEKSFLEFQVITFATSIIHRVYSKVSCKCLVIFYYKKLLSFVIFYSCPLMKCQNPVFTLHLCVINNILRNLKNSLKKY